ncbi:MAG: class I SAM-dependent methyltransferase [Defluviitaleaceae bacterium]|nr:class I SAM-dependent methyltransferase [Defluviitaleaceae bacterium]
MLYHDFLDNTQKPITKAAHYFPIYERHLKKFRNQSIIFWEIGVFEGGSLQMWQRFLGPYAKIIGIDINPICKKHEDWQISVRIGDQADTKFLQEVIDEFGYPDVVIDDGSHHMEQTYASFDFLYDKLRNNGVYLVEDMGTSYMPSFGGGLGKDETFIERSKKMIDLLNARQNELSQEFAKSTFSVCFYESVVVFEKLRWFNPITNIRTPMRFKEIDISRYNKIIFYGCGMHLKNIFNYMYINIMPDEIWDINANEIMTNNNIPDNLKHVPLCLPDFTITDKEKVAIIITMAEGNAKEEVKRLLKDKGFTSVYYV